MPTSHALLVDDDPVFLLATAEMLRRAGFRVQTADHFNPALSILEGTDSPDVLVTDIVMPSSINGIALARPDAPPALIPADPDDLRRALRSPSPKTEGASSGTARG